MPVEFPSTFWTIIKDENSSQSLRVRLLYEKYSPPIRAFFNQRGIEEKDAEDLIQQVFIKITSENFLHKADKSKGKFRTLLIKVAKDFMSDFLRRKGAQKRGGNYKVVHIESIGEAFDPEDVRAEVEENEPAWLENILNRALEEIKDSSKGGGQRYYDVLILHARENLKNKEIAERLGVKESDVKNWLHKGKEILKNIARKLIREYCSTKEEYQHEISVLFRKKGNRIG